MSAGVSKVSYSDSMSVRSTVFCMDPSDVSIGVDVKHSHQQDSLSGSIINRGKKYIFGLYSRRYLKYESIVRTEVKHLGDPDIFYSNLACHSKRLLSFYQKE